MITTRLAAAEDEGFLFQLYASTRMEEVAAWGWGELETEAFLRMQWQMQTSSYRLQYPDAVSRMILWENGRAGRMVTRSTAEGLQLIDISLLPAYRNRGIGTSLLKELQQEAREKGQFIRLHVAPHNPARKLYERLGFVPQEVRDFYIPMMWG